MAVVTAPAERPRPLHSLFAPLAGLRPETRRNPLRRGLPLLFHAFGGGVGLVGKGIEEVAGLVEGLCCDVAGLVF